ncbi:MAG: CDP-alcohol phosphatidyltransferase family protein [Planctomycetaceae bacterium]|nr:CDP-alcohol phosphatidyltransferase family protein [Planctomycetaceae bacterium]MCA9077285.1 CDP-alcohol phosphatidyltransferase family protein [Planctomycetaceae bacterium]
MTNKSAQDGTAVDADRRPIATRDRAFAQQVAHWLATHGASPNGISVAGMICGILAGASLAATTLSGFAIVGFVLAAVFVQMRLLANLFDGMVAVEQNRRSPLGEMFNEVPDRVSDAATLIGAGYALGGSPVWGFTAAVLAVFVAYIRAQGKVAGAPMDFCGPMAKQHRMAAITVSSLLAAGLMIAGLEGSVVSLFGPSETQPVGLMQLTLYVIVVGAIVTAVRRLRRIGRALQQNANSAPVEVN